MIGCRWNNAPYFSNVWPTYVVRLTTIMVDDSLYLLRKLKEKGIGSLTWSFPEVWRLSRGAFDEIVLVGAKSLHLA